MGYMGYMGCKRGCNLMQLTCSLARPSRSTFITSAPATATDSGCAVALALGAALQHMTPCTDPLPQQLNPHWVWSRDVLIGSPGDE